LCDSITQKHALGQRIAGCVINIALDLNPIGFPLAVLRVRDLLL
jgi:hypothetical protein